MDGFKISVGDTQLRTGQTDSQIRTSKLLPMPSKAEGPSFADTLKNAVSEVNQLQKAADVSMQELAVGKAKSIPDVMIAAEKADIALKLMVQVRNKIIESYQEIMKMQV